MKWKHFLYFWPFVYYQSLVDFPHIGPVMQSVDVSLMSSWINCLTNSWVSSDLRCHNTHVMSLQSITITIMTTSSNGNIFRITGHLWGNPPVTGGLPSQSPVTQHFDVSFDLCLNKCWTNSQVAIDLRHCETHVVSLQSIPITTEYCCNAVDWLLIQQNKAPSLHWIYWFHYK